MPRKRLEFHKLSNRSKRRRVNEGAGCSHWSDNNDSSDLSSDNEFHSEIYSEIYNDLNKSSVVYELEDSENINLNAWDESVELSYDELLKSSFTNDNDQFSQFDTDNYDVPLSPMDYVNEVNDYQSSNI